MNNLKQQQLIDTINNAELGICIEAIELYEKVIIVYDKDIDFRLKKLVMELPEKIREQLWLIHETDASLIMVWDKKIPEGYEVDKSIEVSWPTKEWPHMLYDNWFIYKSMTTYEVDETIFKNNLKKVLTQNNICSPN